MGKKNTIYLVGKDNGKFYKLLFLNITKKPTIVIGFVNKDIISKEVLFHHTIKNDGTVHETFTDIKTGERIENDATKKLYDWYKKCSRLTPINSTKGIESLCGTHAVIKKEMTKEELKNPNNYIVDIANMGSPQIRIYKMEPEKDELLNDLPLKECQVAIAVIKDTNPWFVFQVLDGDKRKTI